MNIDGHTRPQIVPKQLLHMSFRELHNSLVVDPDSGGLKEEIYTENGIIIRYSKLGLLFPTQIFKTIAIQGYVWLWMLYIWKKYTFLITIIVCSVLKKLKYQSQNAQIRRSGEKLNFIYETYKIQSYHMGVMFMPKHLIWQSQKCVHVHIQIMH